MTYTEFEESALALIKHKDIMRRHIVEIKQISEGTFEIVKKTETIPLTISKQFTLITKGTLVCENTKKNVMALKENWDEMTQHHNTVLFLNSQTGCNWSISPQVHKRISEAKDIEKSLSALFSTSQI